MKLPFLEACVDSYASAMAAARGGADRIELCANLAIGGTTPSRALFRQVRRDCGVRINVLIRPRFGDFLYSGEEMEEMEEEIRAFGELGADGVVLGVLTPTGELDRERMARLIRQADGMDVTLHRAFDVCADPFRALEEAEALGIDTILTSGGENTAAQGKAQICRLAEAARKAVVLAGAGVDARVIADFMGTTPIQAFHMSGKQVIQSRMRHKNPRVSMGLPTFSEYEIWQTSRQAIAAAREALDQG